MKATRPTYEIVYNGNNITGDILPFVLSFSYTDKTGGETDELELTLEDEDGLWIGEWYPMKGDVITARIFKTGDVLECGNFTVDEVSATGGSSGTTLSIKGIAAGINKKIRSKTCYAHENKTLQEIANTIASKHGFKLEGEIDKVRISRVTQYRETDLKFLQRLANEYGYEFNIRDTTLVFTNIVKIENKVSALEINPKEMISWSISDKTSKTFKTVKLSYHHPREKKVIEYKHKEENEVHATVMEDEMATHVKADNPQQAEIKAKAALYNANSMQQQGSVEIQGSVFALAGNNCDVLGIGHFSGRYYIKSSAHSVTKDGGYTTSLEIRRVGFKEQSSSSGGSGGAGGFGTAKTPGSKDKDYSDFGEDGTNEDGEEGALGLAGIMGSGLAAAGKAFSIDSELEVVKTCMNRISDGSKKNNTAVQNIYNSIKWQMIKALGSIEKRGFMQAYQALNPKYQALQQYIRADQHLAAGNLARQIVASLPAIAKMPK